MSESTNQSSSSSTPTFLETPENAIIDQISAYAQNLAGQMYSWAQGVFQHTSQITDQAVGNFFQVSQSMLGLSNNLTNQYNNLFAPENAQLVADANSYASPARMAVDMGQAGATQAQAGSAALANSEEALRSYGINPADGRYAALDKAMAVQNAANVAGAENTQRNADIATGQRLRSEAVQVGAQLPAAIANVNNTAIQANTGASNATLANANTGANLNRLPNDYLSTAMGVKLPPTGQQSSSQSSGHSSSPEKPSNGSGSGSGAGAGRGGAGGGGGAAWQPQHGGSAGFGTGGGSSGDYSYNDPTAGVDASDFPGNIYNPDPNGAVMGVGNPGDNPDIWNNGGTGFGDQNPFSDPGFGQSYDYGGQNGTFTGSSGAQDTEWGNINYDPGANPSQADWTGGDNSGYDPSANWGDASAYQDNSYTGDAGSGQSYDTSSPGSDYYAGDYSDTGDVFARGGPVPYAGGGAIPTQASPSGGRKVDDIPSQMPNGAPARLNANEFVIPQDVALWKGQEFFQKLIDGSRKARMTAPAQPQPMR